MKYIIFTLSILCAHATAFAQKTVQDYEKLLTNTKGDWMLDSTDEMLGSSKKCDNGEFLKFSTAPNLVIKRTCNSNGRWDTTRLNWSVTIKAGSKTFLQIGNEEYRLFEKDFKKSRSIILTRRTKNGNVRKNGIDLTYVTFK